MPDYTKKEGQLKDKNLLLLKKGMRFIITLIALSFVSYTQAQIAGDMLFGGGIDLIKTDNEKVFNKMQLGLETNYYFTRNLTGSAGFELWVGDKTSISLGGRWYMIDAAFLRVRALIGENDLSIGGGWTRPIGKDLKIEALGDFYFEGEFGVRVGLVYVLRKEEE